MSGSLYYAGLYDGGAAEVPLESLGDHWKRGPLCKNIVYRSSVYYQSSPASVE